ncbi:MAG: hypothetical protein ABJF10_05105 [Chthoniobacter sp.]|uniref:hypothetical protein n=1 Tax=Chthoniobacter sp. TaxID=2510640 RepID=UPI0032A2DA6B
MKTSLPLIVILVLLVLLVLTGCSSEPSTNPNPRRSFNAESGNFEGPSPLPKTNGNANSR